MNTSGQKVNTLARKLNTLAVETEHIGLETGHIGAESGHISPETGHIDAKTGHIGGKRWTPVHLSLGLAAHGVSRQTRCNTPGLAPPPFAPNPSMIPPKA